MTPTNLWHTKAYTNVKLDAHSSVEGPQGAGVQFMNIETLLEYCRVKLKHADEGIRTAMTGLDDITKAQQSLTNLKSAKFDGAAKAERDTVQAEIKSLNDALTNGAHTVTYKQGDVTTKWDLKTEAGRAEARAKIAELEAKLPDLQKRVNTFDDQVNKACAQLEAVGQAEAAKAVREAAEAAKSGGKEGEEKFQKVLDAQTASVGASREMAMVRLQSLVSQRGTMLQMITNMMNALNEAPKAIAGNMR